MVFITNTVDAVSRQPRRRLELIYRRSSASEVISRLSLCFPHLNSGASSDPVL